MQTFYRKYRPQKLGEIVGQEAITSTLLKQLETGKISHAYIFSGSRGTGKTSTARIVAKALNCKKAKEEKFAEPCGECSACLAIAEGNYLDLIEIDAASNRGIDEIRDLREKIRLAPTEGRFKVYIIDEVHMLTNEAFNALLKTLEEPPAHAVFILCTTEPQKIPATIASRAQRFGFLRPTLTDIEKRLSQIAKEEKLELGKGALAQIARAADGAFRDAEVLLEKVASVNPKASEEEVRKIIGRSEKQSELLKLVKEGKRKEAIGWFHEFIEKGGNIRLLAESILADLRIILLLKQEIDKELLGEATEEEIGILQGIAQQISTEKAIRWVNLFTAALVDLRSASIPQLPVELAIIEACGYETEESAEARDEVVIEEKPIEKLKEDQEEKKITQTEKQVEEVEPELPKKKMPIDANLKEVFDNWEKILSALKPKNNSLEIFLRGATPKEIDEGVLVLEFGYRFHKDRFDEPKNRAMLENILEEALGKPVRIKGVVSTSPPAKVVRQPDLPAGRQEQKEEVDPVEIFGKLE